MFDGSRKKSGGWYVFALLFQEHRVVCKFRENRSRLDHVNLPVTRNIDLRSTFISRFDLLYTVLNEVNETIDRKLPQHFEDNPENRRRRHSGMRSGNRAHAQLTCLFFLAVRVHQLRPLARAPRDRRGGLAQARAVVREAAQRRQRRPRDVRQRSASPRRRGSSSR
ncbi:hypothetical protein EDB84DRAFT_1014372 [Lactarius hengduanensis]|nr:hypothetical protein EDB84DRAFT_1014372 [Lactarius hengduanensis]